MAASVSLLGCYSASLSAAGVVLHSCPRRPSRLLPRLPSGSRAGPTMQELLGVPEMPRTQALKQIWAYIKQDNLQDPEDMKTIVCDEKLKNIFGGHERGGFLEISRLLNPHFMK